MTVSRFRAILYTVVAIVAVAGLADATYLTVQALTGETLSCGGSPDCFRVLGSSYAKVGGVPVALLGAFAYFSVFSLRYIRGLWLCASTNVSYSDDWRNVSGTLWFLYMQAFLLHAYCRYCLFSAALTFLIAGLLIAAPPSQRRSRA